MMQLAHNIKQAIVDRLLIIKTSLVYTFQQDTAYWSNNLASIFSTVAFALSMLIFIDVLYGKTDLIAGYNRNEMTFFIFITQCAAAAIFSMLNVDKTVDIIKKGELDLILLKPLPHLFYLSYRRIKTFGVLRDVGPNLLVLALFIRWEEFSFTFPHLIIGSLIFILGFLAYQSFMFLLMMPVFWLGESSQLLNIGNRIYMNSGSKIPWEGFTTGLQLLFTFIFPTIVIAGISTSVLLQKTEPLPMLVLALLSVSIFTMLKIIVWNIALKNYTSASS